MNNIQEFENFPNVIKRFIDKLPKNYKDLDVNDCWEWQGALVGKGYGVLSYKRKNYLAHRLSYMIFTGPIPEDKIIMHTCDNPLCVNPKHLIVGNHSDNIKDCVKKDRHNNTKLDEEKVKTIKWMLKYKKQYGLVTSLANLFGVSRVAITDIQRGKTWSWIEID